MKDTLFSVAADGHERLLLTNDPARALAWCMKNDEIIAGADTIVVARRTDLVALGGSSPRTDATERPAKRASRKEESPAGVPAGMVLVKKLAEDAGMTTEGMRYKLKRLGIRIVKLELHGRPGAVKEVDAERVKG